MRGDNMARYDLRNLIYPGDYVRYKSTKAVFNATDAGRSPGAEIPCDAQVVAVYRDFVVTQLKKVQDCANRHDIWRVNGQVFVIE